MSLCSFDRKSRCVAVKDVKVGDYIHRKGIVERRATQATSDGILHKFWIENRKTPLEILDWSAKVKPLQQNLQPMLWIIPGR